jgi:hypothetical protein
MDQGGTSFIHKNYNRSNLLAAQRNGDKKRLGRAYTSLSIGLRYILPGQPKTEKEDSGQSFTVTSAPQV